MSQNAGNLTPQGFNITIGFWQRRSQKKLIVFTVYQHGNISIT
jgi:hypothetical protein